MKKFGSAVSAALAAAGMLCLIFDSRCTGKAMIQGIDLCLSSVIPNLFPLFVLSGMLMPELARIPVPSGVSRVLGIPSGCEGIFLMGAVGGYPLAARSLSQAVRDGQLSRRQAVRMLGFCSNCGLAFLFGVLPRLFPDPAAPWKLLVIQLESAICVAALWAKPVSGAGNFRPRSVGLGESLQQSVRAMVPVCSWILMACLLRGFLEKWVFGLFSPAFRVLCTGFLEITAGCLQLEALTDPRLRFLFAAAFLCFGGISVWLQIHGIAAEQQLSTGCFARQKLLQTLFGVGFAICMLSGFPFVPLLFLLGLIFFKKQWKFPTHYGIITVKKEVSDHAVS